MEFGVFIQNPVFGFNREGNPDYEHQVIMRELELVQAADRAGFKYVWVTEHHFLDEYSHLSANDVICGYLAHATERIHIGSGIFNPLPQVNHPAKVAERVATLDHITNRRFEFGTGRGAGSHEILGFLAKDGVTDTTTTREIWEETIPEFAKMWLQRGVRGLRRQVVDAPAPQDPAEAVRQGSSRRCGTPRATRRATRWRPARGSACSASRSGRSPSSSR